MRSIARGEPRVVDVADAEPRALGIPAISSGEGAGEPRPVGGAVDGGVAAGDGVDRGVDVGDRVGEAAVHGADEAGDDASGSVSARGGGSA